jgi:hypothetical protein
MAPTPVKILTDEQAIKAWQIHNPFQRASPELIKRIKQIAKPDVTEDAPY